MEMTRKIKTYIDHHQQEFLELLITIAKIPAPSNYEEKRAQFVEKWLKARGAKGVFIDDALNVVYPVGQEDKGPVTVFMAHTDIVFPDTEELSVTKKEGRLYAPGIGDDTANLCALLAVAGYIAEQNLAPKSGQLILVANSGEEGLGNLKGSQSICKRYGSRLKELISFDGYMDKIVDDAVGSYRYRVEVRTEGGHSYGAFGNRNAIAYLASMIDGLYTLKPPVSRHKTTYNVGMIQGGTSVNTIAQQASMLYEFRSDSMDDLLMMEKHFQTMIQYYQSKGITVDVTLLGQRPCKGELNMEYQEALSAKGAALIEKYLSITPEHEAGSTDCNIPLSLGIPAISLGTCLGGGAHTREEWIEISSLRAGYELAFEFILSYL